MREKKDVGGLAMLQVSNLVKKFGGIVAVNDVSLKIDGGEVVGLSTAS
jgi:ABC-type branched-subunit amino acid transport system ATPase component